MNRIFWVCGVIVMVFNFTLSSKALMPGLDRMKQKIKTVGDDSGKISFKEYIDRRKNGTDLLFTQQSEPDLFPEINDLYWCKKVDLIDLLELKNEQFAKDEALLTLKAEIDKKYDDPKKDLPEKFLRFISDMLNEKASIESLVARAMKNIQADKVDKGNDALKNKGKDIFKKLIMLNTSISRLIKLVEVLLGL